jgi:ABC-type dipeptide/oligopeptide/nickel transport system permease component
MSLVKYAADRVIQMIVTLAVIVPLTFLLFRAVPGDPSAAVIGPDLDPSVAADLRQRYGTDQPVLVQFLTYVGNLVHGDLGLSFEEPSAISC